MHDFFLYDGKPVTVSQSCGFEAGDVGIRLAETLPREKNDMMYYDNWFHFLEFIHVEQFEVIGCVE